MPYIGLSSIGVCRRSSAVAFSLLFLALGFAGAASGGTPHVGYQWEYLAADETHGNYDRLLSITYPDLSPGGQTRPGRGG